MAYGLVKLKIKATVALRDYPQFKVALAMKW